jgi:isopentenyl diphosphate isomerase/L-lactate dehydrogenase-like FMN-dependent dehydrogenase
LATDGVQGVEAVIKLLSDELVRSMTLLGATSAAALPGSLGSVGGQPA